MHLFTHKNLLFPDFLYSFKFDCGTAKFLFILFIVIQIGSITIGFSVIGMMVAYIYIFFAPFHLAFAFICLGVSVIKNSECIKLNSIMCLLMMLAIFLNSIGFDYSKMRYLKNSEIIELALNYTIERECMFSKDKQCQDKIMQKTKKEYSHCFAGKLPDICGDLYEYTGANKENLLDILSSRLWLQNSRVVKVKYKDDYLDVKIKSEKRISAEGGIF